MSKCIKFCIKFIPNQAKWSQGWSKIDQNDAQERSKSDPGGDAASGSRKLRPIDAFFHPVCATWAIWGAILGPSGSQKGS